jgi:hypothetical protein
VSHAALRKRLQRIRHRLEDCFHRTSLKVAYSKYGANTEIGALR